MIWCTTEWPVGQQSSNRSQFWWKFETSITRMSGCGFKEQIFTQETFAHRPLRTNLFYLWQFFVMSFRMVVIISKWDTSVYPASDWWDNFSHGCRYHLLLLKVSWSDTLIRKIHLSLELRKNFHIKSCLTTWNLGIRWTLINVLILSRSRTSASIRRLLHQCQRLGIIKIRVLYSTDLGD